MTLASFASDPTRARLFAAGWSRELELRGSLPAGRAVAIVGARAASTVAMDRAHCLARHLAGRGVDVVSGGALGVDGAAHRGALAGGGTTTVVLGTGIDVAYPARHAPLFERVIAAGGALVSMFPRGMQPRRGAFPARNPLIAALADAVLVIEADLRSGSLSTAFAARRLGRIVGAWPGSRGCDRLLATGACIVESAADVDAILAGEPRRAAAVPSLSLDPIAARVVAALASGARGVDAVVATTGLSVREVLRALPAIEAASASARTS